MRVIAEVLAIAREKGLNTEDAAREIVEKTRAAKERLPGMGHRWHSVDPRTAVLFAIAREEGVAGDGALAAVLFDLGFPPEAGKLIFIIGGVAGLTAEVAEEYARGKPMRIRVPLEYDGVPPREI